MIQTAPYRDLHIYYFTGRIDPHTAIGHPDLIGNWEEAGDTFLFFHRPADGWVQTLMDHHPDLTLIDQFQMSYDQWHGGEVKPLQVGRLTIVPTWIANGHASEPGTIFLDPGVVFGTGTHPTTAHCLEAIQMAFDDQPAHRVLDVGTGTGLLALAAARLGADRIVALDLNQLAVQTARRNVVANAMEEQIVVVQGDAKNFMDLPCDLVVSNIHYDVMRQLVQTPGFSRQQRFILSGLLRSQAREIVYRLRQRSIRIIRQWAQDEIWFTFYGRTDQEPR